MARPGVRQTLYSFLKQCEQKSINFTFLSRRIVYLRQWARGERARPELPAQGIVASRSTSQLTSTESTKPAFVS